MFELFFIQGENSPTHNINFMHIPNSSTKNISIEEHKSIHDVSLKHRLNISSSSSMRDNSTDKDTDFLTILGKLRLKNVNRIIFAHININSIRNKFHLLTSDINNKIDILMISETKLDNSFPNGEFIIPVILNLTGWIEIAMAVGYCFI